MMAAVERGLTTAGAEHQPGEEGRGGEKLAKGSTVTISASISCAHSLSRDDVRTVEAADRSGIGSGGAEPGVRQGGQEGERVTVTRTS